MPGAQQAVKVISNTFERDTYELFDHEAQQLRTEHFTVLGPASCCRKGADVHMLAGDDPTVQRRQQQPASEALLRLVRRDSGFWVYKATVPGGIQKLWLVIGDSPAKAHKLCEGDVIKLGRFEFRVRQLVALEQSSVMPELGLEDLGAVCPVLGIPEHANEALCRFCLLQSDTAEDPLIAPCRCQGSIEHVHLGCLRHWLRERLDLSNVPGGSYFFHAFGCELCKATYPTYIHADGSEREPLVEVPPTRPPFVVLENLAGDLQQHASPGLHVVSLAGEKALKLGRGPESDVRLVDVSISRCHAVIRCQDGQFLLEDNHSRYGTLVAMNKPQQLELGNPLSVQMGRTMLSSLSDFDAMVQSFATSQRHSVQFKVAGQNTSWLDFRCEGARGVLVSCGFHRQFIS